MRSSCATYTRSSRSDGADMIWFNKSVNALVCTKQGDVILASTTWSKEYDFGQVIVHAPKFLYLSALMLSGQVRQSYL